MEDWGCWGGGFVSCIQFPFDTVERMVDGSAKETGERGETPSESSRVDEGFGPSSKPN